MLGLSILLLTALVLLTLVLSAMAVRELRRPPRRTVAYAIAHGLACDPGDAGFEYESWTLDRSDGTRLPVWEIALRREATVASALPLTAVCVHGWGESRIDALARRDEWWERCDRIVLYDLRGHGESAPGSDSGSDPGRLGRGEERDLLALLERLGEMRFLLVGWGMGAAIALAAAMQERLPRGRIVAVLAIEPEASLAGRLLDHLAARGYPRTIGRLALRWLSMTGSRPLEFTPDPPPAACPVVAAEAGGANGAMLRLAESLRSSDAARSRS